MGGKINEEIFTQRVPQNMSKVAQQVLESIISQVRVKIFSLWSKSLFFTNLLPNVDLKMFEYFAHNFILYFWLNFWLTKKPKLPFSRGKCFIRFSKIKFRHMTSQIWN